MTLGVIVFGAVFLGGLAVGARTHRPLSVACLVLGAFAGLLVMQAHAPFVAFAAFALVVVGGLLVETVRETVGLLLGRSPS